MLFGRFSSVIMLEWREHEHEEEYYFVGNDPGTVMALWECGLLKIFKVQGMRAQPRLLEYLVHMWDVNEQAFHVGVHTLTLEIDDIYFFDGVISSRLSGITLRKQRWWRTHGLLCCTSLRTRYRKA
jgi:hypothetical protein